MQFRDTALAQGDAYLALFAINSISSWYSLQELRDKIVREHEDEDAIPMVIVANKNVSALCRILALIPESIVACQTFDIPPYQEYSMGKQTYTYTFCNNPGVAIEQLCIPITFDVSAIWLVMQAP